MSSFYHGGEQHMMCSCWTCKVKHSIPWSLYLSACQNNSISIKCPHGHSWAFKTQRDMEEDEKIRQERDRLKQRIAEKDDEIKHQREMREAAERSTTAYRGQVTKIKNRIAGGVCPCCNRWFKGLASHMHTKHKNYKKEDAA